MATVLRELLESVLLAQDCSRNHAESLRHRIDLFGQYLGRAATTHDLEPEVLNRWVKSLQDAGVYKPRTVKHFRDAVLFLWRRAFERGMVAAPPHLIRGVKVPMQAVMTWTTDEIRELVGAVSILRGQVPDTSIRKRDWMRGYIYTACCTGLRRCDLMHWARWQDVSDIVLQVTQRKTGYVVARQLSPQALVALRLLRSSDYLLPWPGDKRRFYESFKRLVVSAGIRPGGPKLLRRWSGSMVERDRPGAGGHFLGHRDPQMFDRHYHDRSISLNVPEPPPEI